MLSPAQKKRFAKRNVNCPLVSERIDSLSGYIAIFGKFFREHGPFWFRGHADLSWELVPTGLRYSKEDDCAKALALLDEFRRIAEIKQARPPGPDDELGWNQVAQHYGLPTRLLDWTESPLVALYFACSEDTKDGIVFVLNPVALNRLSVSRNPRILHAQTDKSIIVKYLRPMGGTGRHSLQTVAVNPIWNSDRIVLQKGAFTLHGSRNAKLNGDTPSLAAVPIPREAKRRLRRELEDIGVNEMTIFPELEHTCRHLKRRAGLEQ